MRVLERAKVEVFDRYGRHGEAGAVVEETLELRGDGEVFVVVQLDPNGRGSVQVPPTTLDDAREAFTLLASSRVPDFLR